MEKDYYKILGVEKTASKDDIKKNFRQLSKKWHPDRCKDESKKAEYEEKFKEIAEAYAVLSDDEQRQKYDNPTTGGGNFHFDGFGGMNFNDIFGGFGFGGNPFEDLFGGGRRNGGQQRVQKGQSLRVVLEVTLEEALSGTKKKIKYKHLTKCQHCNGSGKTDKSVDELCPTCGGTGTEIRSHGSMQIMTTCSRCGGKGRIITNPCPHCNGDGVVETVSEIEIDIPKGACEGYQFIVEGKGHAPYKNEGINGDLIVLIKEKQNDKFIRNEDDLYTKIEVPVIDAILGCEMTVETIDGKKLSTKIPQGVKHGTKIRFGGHGMPLINHDTVRGNMIGIIEIVMPKSLTNSEKELLNRLKQESNFR